MRKHLSGVHRSVATRLAVTAGHLNGIKNMIEDGRDCTDVLIQFAAVKAEIENASKAYLKEYVDKCMEAAAKKCDEKTLEDLKSAIDYLV